MIAIDNFPATITVPGIDRTYDCTVVGIVRAGDHFEFIVVVDDDGDRWVAQRNVVTSPDGEERRP